jgi:tetratricopeptide (TPR) repeat protein
LSSQAAFSSPSTPLNVEFSAKAGIKESQKETRPEPPESIQIPVETLGQSLKVKRMGTGEADGVDHADGPDQAADATQDPVAISKSLRRVRASGELIIEASKKKQEQMNEIIAQAIEGFEAAKLDESDQIPPPVTQVETDEQATDPPISAPIKPETSYQKVPDLPPPPPPPPPIQPKTPAVPSAPRAAVTAGTPEASNVAPAPRAAVAAGTPGASNVAPAVPRRNTGPIAASVTISTANTISNAGQLPPNGPSSVLAQASGLNPKPGFGSKFRLGLITLALLLGIGTYFAFRDRLLTPQRAADPERDLVRVEDQSAQFVRLGERDREEGHYDTALDNFQRALSLTPNNSNVHFLIAQTYYNAGQIDEALKAYKALLRIAPEHLEARLQVAQIYRARGNWSAAYQEYQRIIALDQTSGQAAVALEAIEEYESGKSGSIVSGGSSNTARNKLRPRSATRKSLVLPPATTAQPQISLLPQKFVTAPVMRPPTVLNNNKPEENPDPRILADSRKKLGLRYLNVREHRAAINEFLAALRLTPDDKDIYYFLASSYYGLGQYALAHDYYKRVDRGQYVQVAQSGAQKTEKAAREEFKRRNEMMKNEVKNEFKNEIRKETGSNNSSGKTILNSYKE